MLARCAAGCRRRRRRSAVPCWVLGRMKDPSITPLFSGLPPILGGRFTSPPPPPPRANATAADPHSTYLRGPPRTFTLNTLDTLFSELFFYSFWHAFGAVLDHFLGPFSALLALKSRSVFGGRFFIVFCRFWAPFWHHFLLQNRSRERLGAKTSTFDFERQSQQNQAFCPWGGAGGLLNSPPGAARKHNDFVCAFLMPKSTKNASKNDAKTSQERNKKSIKKIQEINAKIYQK